MAFADDSEEPQVLDKRRALFDSIPLLDTTSILDAPLLDCRNQSAYDDPLFPSLLQVVDQLDADVGKWYVSSVSL